ncbi:hypothetical protein [Olsenella sp. HMSC062G07]|uniref:hypothetical protein n=1 Tax=Olsenella sp. HMSC062G07 TaxID=1739330 RepID=UPI0008A2646D|nr:hypothetical protein [Olsenella sp. HMSC062G07]OFK22146.1 hypothetical protein HMPREF2826_02710 [Olsenella sp. HMSC062G07]
MDAREEYVLRIAQRQRRGRGLSDAAYAELLLAVRHDPERFAGAPQDESMALLGRALDRYAASIGADESRDDEEYLRARQVRLATLQEACAAILRQDPSCVDARLCALIARDLDPDDLLWQLKGLERDALPSLDAADGERGADPWSDVLCRPALRVKAAICRTYLESARYDRARESALELLRLSPLDCLGARHTAALACARLEDESGFEALVARFGGRGDAWQGLARLILLFKLARPAAARRALAGYDRLCEGGVFALLRPVYVEPYMPDRPATAPYGFDETTLAVHEADAIIVDVPDLVSWVESVPGMTESAAAFARRSGFEF